MRTAYEATRNYFRELWDAWNRFWFLPVDPATLSIIRILAGGLMLYTHAVWSLDLEGFVGSEGYLPVARLRELQSDAAGTAPWHVWSLFYLSMSPWLLWSVHLLALAAFACLTLGLFSRTAAVLAYLLAVSYAHRVTPGAYFGLDKINCMLAMYLMLGPSGARYSLDRAWRRRRGDASDPPSSVSANLAVRLIQLHLCIIYLFTGLAKFTGETWQAGTAVWWAVANKEYQSIDMTWLASQPILTAFLTHVTVFWEIFYPCAVWNRFARPLALWIALGVHGGIAVALGMMTFGSAMLIANLAFIQPATIRRWCDPLAARVTLAATGSGAG